MTFSLGLTGSIGMGKSTTAKLFAELGCAVWDADAAVHRLYAKGGAAVVPMSEVFPDAIEDEAVSRVALKRIITEDSAALKRIEAIVHPLVFADRAGFRTQEVGGILVFDIPLLYEAGGAEEMDAVACVLVPGEVQEKRVMARGTMTQDQFLAIRAKQMPAEEKAARADYVIVTDTPEHAETQVAAVIADIRRKMAHA